MPDSLHRFAWCEWSKWINLNKEYPDYITAIALPFGLDKDYFRHVAILRARERDAKAHVAFDVVMQCIRLQFCWKKEYHQGIHVDGVRLHTHVEYQRYAPWPPITDEERSWGMTRRI